MSATTQTGVSLEAAARVLELNRAMAGVELFSGVQRPVNAEQNSTFRLSPEPFYVEQETIQELAGLGSAFYAFYRAANRLYQQSVRGTVPAFVHEYLDMGKPERVIEYNRLNRFKNDLPMVIRPDVILTDEGPVITELDSVPGGMGLLAFLSQQYANMGFAPVGGANAMVEQFAAGLRALRPHQTDPLVAVVVSDESADYRGEMTWLAQAVCATGLRMKVCHPRDLLYREDGLYLPLHANHEPGGPAEKIDIVYRFFELFDLKNIPQADLILYAVRKEMVAITPPLKSQLEEKLLFALWHHPVLARAWQTEIARPESAALSKVLPYTWILDPQPLPPHAVIPDLTLSNGPVTNYLQLASATQRERELVVKPSGFSPEAWGSRGVTVGHDVSAEEWEIALQSALMAFRQTPHILQRFSKARKDSISYYDFESQTIRRMHGRARLCPYYFVVEDQVRLAGILATVVPLNKKVIHGMVDAVMAPVAVMP